MICPACHDANADDARFCEHCGQALELACPACDTRVRGGTHFCRQCGQNLLPPSESPQPAAVQSPLFPQPVSLDKKLDQLQRYLPAQLAEKILANRGRLTGERKLVTVLFADIAGYTALSAQIDK